MQQLRQSEPKYSCVVPVDRLTGNQDEEIITFGVSANEAKTKAEQLLANTYGCGESETLELMLQAPVEPLVHWCSPQSSQGES